MTTSQPRTAQGIMLIRNDSGLHTRPATEIVKCAVKFKSDIKLIHRRHEISAKSLLGILMLAAKKGTRITIKATGEDAPQAVEALLALAQSQFHIKY